MSEEKLELEDMLEIAGEGNIDGKQINNDQSESLYGPSNMIYEQQNRPTKLQYEIQYL